MKHRGIHFIPYKSVVIEAVSPTKFKTLWNPPVDLVHGVFGPVLIHAMVAAEHRGCCLTTLLAS